MDNWVFLNKTNNIIYNKNKRKDYNLFNPQTFDISQLWYDTDTVTDNTDTTKQNTDTVTDNTDTTKQNTDIVTDNTDTIKQNTDTVTDNTDTIKQKKCRNSTRKI